MAIVLQLINGELPLLGASPLIGGLICMRLTSQLHLIVIALLAAGFVCSAQNSPNPANDTSTQLAAELGQQAATNPQLLMEIERLTTKAYAGDPASEFALGYLFQRAGNYDSALQWYHKSADHAYSMAQAALGLMYQLGRGVPQDFAQALKWNQLASAQGNIIAENNLGLMYARGQGIAPDPDKARELFEESAQGGWPGGQANLAYTYAAHGANADQISAYRWCLLARGGGEQSCDSLLSAIIGRMSPADIATGDDLAFSWFQQRAVIGKEGGPVHVHWDTLPVSVGDMYVRGLGVAKDPSQASRWYQWGAEHGNAAAQDRLGEMYLVGFGLQKNLKQALAWLQKSAQAGDASGERDLGSFYLNAPDPQRDAKQGFAWVSKAADQGDVGAISLKAYCYQYGAGVERDLPRSVQLYEQAMQSGSLMALNNLAWIYANSDVPGLRNPSKALEYAVKAANASNGKDASVLDTLAAAYFGQAQYDEAVETEQKALTLKPGESSFQERLQKYQQAQAAQKQPK